VRVLFILARYLALFIQMYANIYSTSQETWIDRDNTPESANVIVSSIMTVQYSRAQRVTEKVCFSALVFHSITCYVMLVVLYLILMLRGWSLIA
jgi:hypothetical protein